MISQQLEEKWQRDRKRREAEEARRRKKAEAEAARAREKERARILAAGGEEALEYLQREAFENDLCGYYADDQEALEVCTRPANPKTFIWCRTHDELIEREARRRVAERAAEKE